MKTKFFVAIFFILLSYLYASPAQEEATPPEVLSQPEKGIELRGFVLAEKTLQPGGLLEAFAPFSAKEHFLVLSNAEKKILYSIPGLAAEIPGFEPFLYFIQGVSSTLETGTYTLSLVRMPSTDIQGEYTVEITDRQFHREEIALNEQLTGIRTDRSDRRVEEGKRLSRLLASVNNDSRFILNSADRGHPIDEIFYTSFFGDRRVFVYSSGRTALSIHNGLDYRAAVGESIFAPFAGRVVMAEQRIVTGNTIVLEHLPAVYTLYYHLDSLNVMPGDVINFGDKLGTAGNTGLSTGSHLHWEVRIRTVAVDPELFLEATLLDKDRIMAIIGK